MASDRDEVIHERDREDAQKSVDEAEERLRVLRMEFGLFENPWWDQYREWLEEQLEHLKNDLVRAEGIENIRLLQGTCRQTAAQIERRETILKEIEEEEAEIRRIQTDWNEGHPAPHAGGATGGA